MSHNGASGDAVTLTQKINLEEEPYEFLRPADPVDNILKLESVLGLFSNVIIAASYHHENNKALTSDVLFRALRIVIEQHPSLHVLGIPQPSPNKTGNHRAWKARLKTIDLEGCTTFIDNYDDSKPGMRALFQRTHNEWFDLDDRTRPLWRLIIVNHVHVLFVWQHLVCDANGGIAFHKSLIGALNKLMEEDNIANVTSNIVTTSTKPLPTDAADLYREKGYKPNFFASVLKIIGFILFRLWYGRRNFFFNDATYSKTVPVLGEVKEEERCVTSVQSLRLSPVMLEKCLVACKKNQTTFTSLLATVIDMTLATDVYPLSKVRMLNRQVDLRRYLPQTDDMVNLSTTVSRMSRVYKYREVGRELLPSSSRFWGLAREDSHWVQDYLSDVKRPTPTPIQDSMFSTPEDEELFATQIIPYISLIAEGSYTISNLGAVDSKFGRSEGHEPWELSAMEFSCCATKSCIGSLLYFAVLSLKGGECVINVSYEKGVLEDEKVREIIEKIEGRLRVMFEE